MREPARSWDYVIVGAGSAGCVLANRLTEDRAVHVLLIEAGGADRSPVILAPAATDLYAMGRPAWDWCHVAEPDPTRYGRADLWSRGRVLGGSSSINGTIYVRGHRRDFDRWAAEGARGWSYSEVLPYFRRAECNDLGESKYHGMDGPLAVQALRYVHPLTDRFIAAAIQSGMPFNSDVNGVTQEGVGPNQATQRSGWRHSAARAYLRPISHRPNVTIVTRAHATRVTFAGDRAAGVEYRQDGTSFRAAAACEVILSAGAIGSPHLLLLSGIGSAAMLKAHGIGVVSHRPAVGENLQEHVGCWLNYRTRVSTLNNARALLKQALHGLNWLLFGRGPATTAGAQAVAFTRSEQSVDQPDIQLHFTPVGFTVHESHVELNDEPTVSVLANVCRPKSRGHILLRSAEPSEAPRIHMPLLAEDEDVKILTAGCRIARRIMCQPQMAPLTIDESAPGDTVTTDEEWADYLREASVPCYHPVGTCRMGDDDASVVDPELRVRGVTGLRVADASIMPRIPSGNTNAAAIMIGEKAADLIRGHRHWR